MSDDLTNWLNQSQAPEWVWEEHKRLTAQRDALLARVNLSEGLIKRIYSRSVVNGPSLSDEEVAMIYRLEMIKEEPT